MIKPLIILVNTFFIYLFSIIFGDGSVTVVGNFPKSATAGTEFVAEIKVTKGSVGGFAKLQLDVPQGVTVKELESKGGNFSFAGTTAKIIWTATPSEADFIIKMVLTADASVTGSKNFASKFSFVNNNAKESVEMSPVTVDFGGSTSVVVNTPPVEAVNTTPVTATEPVKTPDPVVTTNNTTGITTTAETFTYNPGENASSVSCSRVITKGVNDREYNVLVKIKKPGVKGFAKYQELIPEGYIIKGGNTSGSSFSVSDGKAKFVWVSLPPEDEMNVSYVIELGQNALPNAGLNGEFSYLENDQTKKKKLPIQFITDNQSIVTNIRTVKDPSNSDSNGGNSNLNSDAGNGNNTSSSNGSVAYRVQIGAFTNAIASSVLTRKFNVTENIKSEMAEGFSKFMIGNYDTYKTARDNREKMKNKGCRTAFVVA